MSGIYFACATLIFGFYVEFIFPNHFSIGFDQKTLMLIISGVFTWAWQNSFSYAIKLDSPANAFLYGNCSVLMSLIGDYLIFGSDIKAVNVVGAIVFLTALAVLVRLRK